MLRRQDSAKFLTHESFDLLLQHLRQRLQDGQLGSREGKPSCRGRTRCAYSIQELFTTQGGGSPYGPGHVAGGDNRREIDPHEAAICRALGRRLAEVGLRLQTK
jgi:hypothetical protein